MRFDLAPIFEAAQSHGASDILLTADAPPVLRIAGELVHLEMPPLDADATRKQIYSLLSDREIAELEREGEVDFAVTVGKSARFRGNAYRQRGAVACALRLVPTRVPTFEELRLPKVLEDLSLAPQGLVLITGPTGHGKSTTQAAMVDFINRTRACHVITIEDPIEFEHHSARSIVEQREVGRDTGSFARALKHVLRESPDVILIGEMRDLETIAAALTAAETGHLVLATLHTNSAAQSIDRLIDVFPPHQQNQIRIQLSFCLLAALAQRLLPRADGKGLVLATELLRATPAVGNLIREAKGQQIASIIETQAKSGMHTLDASIKRLYREGLVTREEAQRCMANPAALADKARA